MKFQFFAIVSVLAWFFFWLRPRVEDGRINEIYTNIEKRIKNK